VGWRRFATVGANAGHHAIARLQSVGALGALITQNVDGLHQAAGSRNVVELHGALAAVVCLACGARSRRAALDARIRELNPNFHPGGGEVRPDGDIELAEVDVAGFVVPRCLCCDSDLLKPDVVFFGELLPAEAIERAFALARRARLLLVVGSALEVHPVAGLPLETLGAGGELAIVNRGRTPYDAQATLRIQASAGEVLSAVVELLRREQPQQAHHAR
jgi:NAD-dependent SIR2 family protein deacetylase